MAIPARHAAPRPRERDAAPPDPPHERNTFAAGEPAEPTLVIGRIDVVVVAREAPPQAAAGSDNLRGFLSRNYLKRL